MSVKFHPKSSLVLFVMMFLFWASSINSIEGIQGEFIRASCKATRYPTLCYDSLSKYASTIQTSPRLLAKTALLITRDAARSTYSLMSKLSDTNMTRPGEDGPMKDCLELLSDAIDELTNSMAEMDQVMDDRNCRFHLSNIQTWASAALTDESTCTDGIVMRTENTKDITMVRNMIDDLEERTSNALSLINSYASQH
ncbi:hypothetical protein vseg_014613 [Gypsophila vaccaria]